MTTPVFTLTASWPTTFAPNQASVTVTPDGNPNTVDRSISGDIGYPRAVVDYDSYTINLTARTTYFFSNYFTGTSGLWETITLIDPDDSAVYWSHSSGPGGTNLGGYYTATEDTTLQLVVYNRINYDQGVYQINIYADRLGDDQDIWMTTGTSQNDKMHGTDFGETMAGNAGDDRIRAYNGNDTVSGGEGADTIVGGGGDDYLEGGNGSDFVFGNMGNDTVLGGEGDDFVFGGKETDQVYGNAGNDFVVADDLNDLVIGGDGNDLVFGNRGNDKVYGNAGNDFVFGGLDDDELFGGEGDDVLWGDAGSDTMYGEGGNDIFEFAAGSGADLIAGFDVNSDRLRLTGGLTYTVTGSVHAVITFSSGDVVALSGVDPSLVTTAIFV